MNDPGNDHPGTAGYGENAEFLVAQYESVTFEDIYGPLTRFVPAGGLAIDIGAGTGRDAAALAERGFEVLAVEPTAELRRHGQRLHPHSAITWVADGLPGLTRIGRHGEACDLVLMTAVWMHLDQSERDVALPRLASLLGPSGRLLMSVRKGVVPLGRRMFEVSIGSLVDDARHLGLSLLGKLEKQDMLGRSDVSWTMLAFDKTHPERSSPRPAMT